MNSFFLYSLFLYKETGDSRYIYQNGLNKICFQHDMAHENLQKLARRTGSDKILCEKVFNIVKNAKYNGYQRCLV